MNTKMCLDCLQVKLIEDFGKDSYRKDKLTIYCLVCYRKRNTRNRKARFNSTPSTQPKKCVTCGQVKPASAFNALKRAIDGLDYNCRDCYNLKRKKWKRS